MWCLEKSWNCAYTRDLSLLACLTLSEEFPVGGGWLRYFFYLYNNIKLQHNNLSVRKYVDITRYQRRLVAKRYFETYKSYDHKQNFRPLSQKFSEIWRFEKFEFLRFCLTLTHRNCHNSLNFWDTGLIFWIYSSFYVFYKSCLAT